MESSAATTAACGLIARQPSVVNPVASSPDCARSAPNPSLATNIKVAKLDNNSYTSWSHRNATVPSGDRVVSNRRLHVLSRYSPIFPRSRRDLFFKAWTVRTFDPRGVNVPRRILPLFLELIDLFFGDVATVDYDSRFRSKFEVLEDPVVLALDRATPVPLECSLGSLAAVARLLAGDKPGDG
jgi:hypothetical protein